MNTKHNVFFSYLHLCFKKFYYIDFTSFEAIHVEITLNSQSFRLVNIYRPPSCNFGAFLNEFETMVANYILHPSEIVFCGDFNIHMDDVVLLITKLLRDLRIYYHHLAYINMFMNPHISMVIA